MPKDHVHRIALLGAGFSRNWGGWLASEFFDDLLGRDEIDPDLKKLLWDFRDRGGFEAALAELEDRSHIGTSTIQGGLRNLTKAISGAFLDMNASFAQRAFEFSNLGQYQVASFLAKFDAIFTLNQDLLLESHYLSGDISLLANDKWNGAEIPGIKVNPAIERAKRYTEPCSVDETLLRLSPRLQPYIKLHGSSNWFEPRGGQLVVFGGNKPQTIARHRILSWNREQFRDHLGRPRTRLLVVGYGFADQHINDMLHTAAKAGSIRMLVVDPSGASIFTQHASASERHMMEAIRNAVVGFSTRALSSTFSNDPLEHSKLVRFLNPKTVNL